VTGFQFRIEGLEATGQPLPVLRLCELTSKRQLDVRLCAGDAQLVALTLSGVQTPTNRLAGSLLRLAHVCDGQPSEVRLTRGTGNLVEAQLVIARGFEEVVLPLAFADAVMLARCGKLAISGDESLAPLMVAQHDEHDDEVALSPAISAFLNSL
jgi:hypothetical protein